MAFTGFNASDFKVFDLEGFQPRMAAIRGQIRPKLDALGQELVTAPARATGGEAYAHVAKHARRFEIEHDEEPAALLADLSTEEIARLADELTRTRDGQLVVGRRVSQADAIKWGPTEYTKAATATFEALALLYRLR